MLEFKFRNKKSGRIRTIKEFNGPDAALRLLKSAKHPEQWEIYSL